MMNYQFILHTERSIVALGATRFQLVVALLGSVEDIEKRAPKYMHLVKTFIFAQVIGIFEVLCQVACFVCHKLVLEQISKCQYCRFCPKIQGKCDGRPPGQLLRSFQIASVIWCSFQATGSHKDLAEMD